MPQRRLVRLSRLAVAVLMAVALVLGLTAEDLVFWLVLFAWAGLGASLGPTSLLALYWRRTTRAGVLAGLVATVAVSLATAPPPRVGEMFAVMDGETEPR